MAATPSRIVFGARASLAELPRCMAMMGTPLYARAISAGGGRVTAADGMLTILTVLALLILAVFGLACECRLVIAQTQT
jgi:hypothetical protein